MNEVIIYLWTKKFVSHQNSLRLLYHQRNDKMLNGESKTSLKRPLMGHKILVVFR